MPDVAGRPPEPALHEEPADAVAVEVPGYDHRLGVRVGVGDDDLGLLPAVRRLVAERRPEVDGVDLHLPLSCGHGRGDRGPRAPTQTACVGEKHLVRTAERPAREERVAEIAPRLLFAGGRVVDVVEAEGGRDRLDTGGVHLLERDHVGAGERVLAERGDRLGDPPAVLDVEGHDPKRRRRGGRRRRSAGVARSVGIEVVEGGGAGGCGERRRKDERPPPRTAQASCR
jgi:hypothetical protein